MHVCFVAPYLYPVLAGRDDVPVIGGAEVQQSLLAKGLARKGVRITALCFDFGQDDGCDIDGVRVLKLPTMQGGMPGIRFLHPRLTSLWRAMSRANADIYYQRCAGAYTGVVAAFCKYHRKKMVYACASDNDLQPHKSVESSWRDRRMYAFGLRRAHAVVLQTAAQASRLPVSAKQLRAVIPSCHAARQRAIDDGDQILWVGAMRRHKRPETFLALARSCPHLSFTMVGGACASGTEHAYFEEMRRGAEALPNLTFTGFLPFAEAERYFDRAALLVNTSDVEGFPNTFLQAWARGVPTLSFFDCGAGDAEGAISPPLTDVHQLEVRIRSLMADAAARNRAGQRCLRYFQAHHAEDVAVNACAALFGVLLHTDP